jgi:hypothetical protein
MSALIPTSGGVPVSIQGISEKEVSVSMKISGDALRENKFILYAGPKEYDRLASYHKYLEESIDFGWFILEVGSPFDWLPNRYSMSFDLSTTSLKTTGSRLFFSLFLSKSYFILLREKVLSP